MQPGILLFISTTCSFTIRAKLSSSWHGTSTTVGFSCHVKTR